MTLKKMNYSDIFRVGSYRDSSDKKSNFPLVLEKKDMRIAFLNYSCDSLLLDLPSHQVNFFEIDSVRKDVKKARDTMMAEFVIAYIDWAKNDSLKLTKVAELLNMGIDVIIGTGNGEAFTNADLLAYSDGTLKLHIDNIGHFNAESNERARDKSAVIEVVLKKDKVTKKVTTHDMGFIPIWTLMDNDRYAVLPISNIEEKHIEDINLNIIQYSAMKIALTDMRFAFFDKIPKIHRVLSTLVSVGLGYVKLGQPSTTVSGGEAQRIKLATELSKKGTGNTIYILDEPSTGLHFEDIRMLLEVLQRLVEEGNTVLVIEHNLDIVKVADYLVDIGPEGGKGGGEILFSGTPENLVKKAKERSHTAVYLELELG
jgi:ABC-type lipopolysaccharide export system ATPase subunit